jgi:hypothetical protein
MTVRIEEHAGLAQNIRESLAHEDGHRVSHG